MNFISDNFSDITANTPGANARRWNTLVGAPDLTTFVAGTTQTIELKPGNGEDWLTYFRAPYVTHQSAEVKIVHGASFGSTALTGVFVRWQNVNNFVALYYDHNTQRISLMQRIAGVDYIIANPADTRTTGSTGVSLRLEVVGKRARYWFNTNFFDVEDEPPLGAADLLFEDTVDGEWGIYFKTNSGTSAQRACQFQARELPSVTLAPPDVYLEDADAYDFVAITAMVASVPADALYIEWRVCPADPDDFAEIYSDVAIASLTSRVLFVRSGYAYDVQARSISTTGVRGDWTTAYRITASGSKVAPTAATFPDDDFPDVAPDYVMQRQQEAAVSATLSDTSRERVSSPWIRPRNSFQLRFQNRQLSDIQRIMDFFDEMEGRRTAFKWTHPASGEQFAMRFDTDELSVRTIDGGTESPVFSLDAPITEVVVGAVSTIPIAVAFDIAAFLDSDVGSDS